MGPQVVEVKEKRRQYRCHARHCAGHRLRMIMPPLAWRRRRGGHDGSGHEVNLALGWRLADVAQAPASTFLPSAGCTRVTLKRPSAQTTVKPSASTAAISPILPPMPFGSFAGSGLASKILTAAPPSVDHAPGAGLQPRISRSISC